MSDSRLCQAQKNSCSNSKYGAGEDVILSGMTGQNALRSQDSEACPELAEGNLRHGTETPFDFTQDMLRWNRAAADFVWQTRSE